MSGQSLWSCCCSFSLADCNPRSSKQKLYFLGSSSATVGNLIKRVHLIALVNCRVKDVVLRYHIFHCFLSLMLVC